jgi:uncharacterized protein
VTTRVLLWRGLGGWEDWATGWHAEGAEVVLHDDRLSARGTQLGAEPDAYRLEYELETGAGWVTERLTARVTRAAGTRELELRRDAATGAWTADGEPVAGVGPDALDCDINYSPLTNSMPLLRERGNLPREFVMAWVDVPSLEVVRSDQRYEPIDDHRVRYADPGHREGFNAELTLDDDGLLVRYEYLAERV